MRRTLKVLFVTTALVGISTMSYAVTPAVSSNGINIDVGSTGSGVGSLAINQDSTYTNNNVSGNGTGTAAAFTAKGQWQNINISQTGSAAQGSNVLKGGIASMGVSSGNSLVAAYTTTGAGDNGHSLNIVGNGTSSGPTSASIDIAMTNNGAANNTVTDTLTATGALVYKLKVNGTGNTVNNTISGTAVTLQGSGGNGTALALIGDSNTVNNTISTTGAITLQQTLTGNSNSLTNQGAGSGTFLADSLTETVSVTGNNNTLTNNSTGTGARTINTTLASNNNTVTNTFSGSGAETASLTADANSNVNYTLTTSGANTLASATLTGVKGASGAVGIQVSQTAANTSTILTVNGGGFTMGSILGTGNGILGAGNGITVTQASTGATLVANVTGTANGYTTSFSQ